MAYHLDLFTVETWDEFKQSGATISGFRENRWSRVKKIEKGDRLLCYLVGAKRWVGVLEVVGDPFYSPEPKIWASDDFPSRLPVEVELELTPETAVPVAEMLSELSWYPKIKDKKDGSWGAFFLGSPQSWSDEDGELVVEAVRDAIANPIVRPVPKSALRRRKPAAVDSGTELGPVTLPVPDADEEHDAELVVADSTTTATPEDHHETEHTEIQALLVRLGNAMGHRVFVARGDQNRTWKGKALVAMKGVTDSLPTHFNAATNKIVEQIDVLWLDDNSIAAAFEVERTTSIYSGLLRMSDLLVMQPNLDIPIFLVAPEARRDKVLREVNRPTFKALKTKKPLYKVCRFVSFEGLRSGIDQYSNVLRYMQVGWVRDELSESCELDDA